MRLSDTLHVDDGGWRLTETGWDADRAVAVGSNFLCGNGYLGYRATTPEQGASDYVALVVTDTYDCADGHWRELSTAPNPLYVIALVDGTPVRVDDATDVGTSLDLRNGEYRAAFRRQIGDRSVRVEVERFASYDQLHLVAQRWTLHAETEAVVEIEAGIDADIWSLNGRHLPAIALDHRDDVLTAIGTTIESDIDVAVASTSAITGGSMLGESIETGDDRSMRRWRVQLAAGESVVVDTVGVVMSSNDVDDPLESTRRLADRCAGRSYTELRQDSRSQWESIWDVLDVRIDGDVVDQAALRFSAYHHRICTPTHSEHLPIGARGLSCQAYQGAAFWDQEVYNLPSFLFTEPDIARSILAYRHHTLDGARRKAARLGYHGAFYAWISGKTGDELCPDYFFTDVLTGRPIRNHFNVWQMHVAPDVVTTMARYVDVTGDKAFLVEHGAEVAFEVARFLHSFVRYDEWRGVYHCIRLLGPDEWHENVDDNAFTNYQVEAALAFAVETYELLERDHPDALAQLAAALDLTADEVDGWRRVHDRMLLPEPRDDGLIEQFAGFFALEDTTPDEVRTRLLHPQEYWGWPNGVAVATQVSKQADVAMLMWLHGHRFDAETRRANYEYYERRCSHDSSLSHAAHGMVAARLGDAGAAHQHFRATATVDLLNTQHAVVGGTFIGGIHTAACSGTYQLATQGFGGLDFSRGRLTIDPVLPPAWTSLTYPVVWRSQRLDVTVTAGDDTVVCVTAAATNSDPVELAIAGEVVAVAPGDAVTRSA